VSWRPRPHHAKSVRPVLDCKLAPWLDFFTADDSGCLGCATSRPKVARREGGPRAQQLYESPSVASSSMIWAVVPVSPSRGKIRSTLL